MQRGQSRQQKRQLLEFSELPRLPSAGSRPGCFHTSLENNFFTSTHVHLLYFELGLRSFPNPK
jgi:hypothetical protein